MLDDIRRGPVLDGILVQIVEASQGTASANQSQLATQPWPPRPDAPVRRPALRASHHSRRAQPANRKRALNSLDKGMLARSSHQRVESRLRTWRRYARPEVGLAHHLGDCIGVVEGGAETTPSNGGRRPLVKSIVRGLPGARLKEVFALGCLARLAAAFSTEDVAHMVDVVIVVGSCSGRLQAGVGVAQGPRPHGDPRGRRAAPQNGPRRRVRDDTPAPLSARTASRYSRDAPSMRLSATFFGCASGGPPGRTTRGCQRRTADSCRSTP